MITPYFNINDMKANEAVEFYKKLLMEKLNN